MSRYAYPAVFLKEDEGGYSVTFPDFPHSFSQGDNMEEAIYMAEDCLAYTIFCMEKDNEPIPAPSDKDSIKLNKDELLNYIRCDTIEYQKKNNNKAVKKTLTIPEWLNEAAIKANLNFSQILQDGLKKNLNL